MFINDIFTNKQLNESLRDGEYYTYKVFFDDGTDETLNFSSDDIDWDRVGAKREKKVINAKRLGGIQGSQHDTPKKPHQYPDDSFTRAQRAYDKQIPEGAANVPWNAVVEAILYDQFETLMDQYGLTFDDIEHIVRQHGFRSTDAVKAEYGQDLEEAYDTSPNNREYFDNVQEWAEAVRDFGADVIKARGVYVAHGWEGEAGEFDPATGEGWLVSKVYRMNEADSYAEVHLTGARFHAQVARMMEDLVDEYQDQVRASTTTPSAPDTTKFRAHRGGMIEYAHNLTVQGGYYAGSKTYIDFIKVGSGLDPKVMKDIFYDFHADMMDVFGIDVKPGVHIKTTDGYTFFFPSFETGSNWGGFGFLHPGKRKEQGVAETHRPLPKRPEEPSMLEKIARMEVLGYEPEQMSAKLGVSTGEVIAMLRHLHRDPDEGLETLDDIDAMYEAGPFSYGAKTPRKGSVADLAAKKRKEQEKGKQPVEPRDQMVGTARVTKGVEEGVTSSEIKQAYADIMKTKPHTPERKAAVKKYQALRADALKNKKQELEEAKHFRTAYGWAGGRNEKTGKTYKHPEQISADKKAKQGISKDKETEFHAKLDTLVHNTFGKRKVEMEEGSVQDKLHKRHQELRKKSGLPDPNYYKELKATYDLPDEERYAKAAELKKKYKVAEARKAEQNFDIEDIKNLESIRDLATLKLQAFNLISRPSAKPMKPEKVEWLKQRLEDLKSPMAVIKLMYDLLLSGEGHAVIGSRHSMNPNSYRGRFGESTITNEDVEKYVEELERAGYTTVQEEKVRLDKKCWKGKKIGNPKTKMKGGVRVNNCVPAKKG